MKLHVVKVLPGVIYEVLVSSKSRSGEVNIAPMGVIFSDNLEEFILRPFTDTQTYRNLSENPEGVVNITRDPRYFILSLLDEGIVLEESRNVVTPRIKEMEAYVEFRVTEIHMFSEKRAEMKCKIIDDYLGRPVIEPYTRAAYALIEAAVNASRIKPYLRQGLGIGELLSSIEYCKKIVEKTAAKTELEEFMISLLRSSLLR